MCSRGGRAAPTLWSARELPALSALHFPDVLGLAQLALSGNATAPLVGASGAIAGLMGAYVGLFPRAHLYQVMLFIRWRVPVWFYLGAWVAMNALIGAAELQHAVPEAGVAWWAHVGGFAAGLVWALTAGRIYKEPSPRA